MPTALAAAALLTLGACTPDDPLAQPGPAGTTPHDSAPLDSGETGQPDTADTGPTDTGPTDTGPTDTGPTDTGTPALEPAPLAELSDGVSPDQSEPGTKTFSSHGVQREVAVLFPEKRPSGMPALFVWHPMGYTGAWLVEHLELQAWADELEVVLVVPESKPDNPIEWGFMGDSEDDLALYDDLRTCVVQQLGVDTWRISSVGGSAGGLWNTYLSLRRSDTLASVLTTSGGAEPLVEYVTAEVKFPALLMWGGEGDCLSWQQYTVDFEQMTLELAQAMLADGHHVVACDHGEGHNLPTGIMDTAREWVLPHVFGQPTPFADGDLSALPDYCAVAELKKTDGGTE